MIVCDSQLRTNFLGCKVPRQLRYRSIAVLTLHRIFRRHTFVLHVDGFCYNGAGVARAAIKARTDGSLWNALVNSTSLGNLIAQDCKHDAAQAWNEAHTHQASGCIKGTVRVTNVLCGLVVGDAWAATCQAAHSTSHITALACSLLEFSWCRHDGNCFLSFVSVQNL